MSFETLAHLIETYRYGVFIPLAFIEGPIVSFVAGTLAAVGYLNVYLALAILFARDIIIDSACYFFGRFAKNKSFTKRILSKLSVSDGQLDEVRTLWEKHGVRTMFLSKLSYGISAAFLIVAGMVEMPFNKFFKYAALVAVVQYGTLFFLGYFFGSAFGSLYAIFTNIQYVIAVISVLAIAYYLFKNYMRSKLISQSRPIP